MIFKGILFLKKIIIDFLPTLLGGRAQKLKDLLNSATHTGHPYQILLKVPSTLLTTSSDGLQALVEDMEMMILLQEDGSVLGEFMSNVPVLEEDIKVLMKDSFLLEYSHTVETSCLMI